MSRYRIYWAGLRARHSGPDAQGAADPDRAHLGGGARGTTRRTPLPSLLQLCTRQVGSVSNPYLYVFYGSGSRFFPQ